jgi:hypothetical protein
MSDPITDLKRELLAAAERRHGHAAVRAGRRRWRELLGRNRLLLIAATLAIAAAVALVFTAPWSNSPRFLAKAQAALTPHAGTVLHEKWEATWTSTDPACTVKRGPDEIWIDQTPPHRYRVLFRNDLPAEPGVAAGMLACAKGAASEFGGTVISPWPLRFVPPNSLTAGTVREFRFPLDQVTYLREAISAGRAHDEGKTQLSGRTVERIRLDPPSDCPLPGCPREPSYAYVDPETFYPVETRSSRVIALVGGPVVARFHTVERFLTYEYLPRTEANLALTDIRAQHPNATGP